MINHLFTIVLLKLLLLVWFSPTAHAQWRVAVVGKTKNDSFYQQSYKGCLHFAKTHQEIDCIYDGPDDYQDVRAQVIKVNALMKQGIDALLISTTDSAILVNGALTELAQKNIPVITFDSDLLPEHQTHRLSYVGTNNFDFGRALGEFIKQYQSDEKQMLCLQSGHQTTPNLNERIAGVRFALSGQKTDKINGQNGWYEHPRCPLFSLGKRSVAVHQLKAMILQQQPLIFLAVAGFAQFSPDYIKQITPYKTRINKNDVVFVSADTEDTQLKALKLGLSTANIGQKPFEMGRFGTELLYNYLTKKQLPKQQYYYLDYHYCTEKNVKSCTKNH
ncbi:sugar ABC transporter substrate-binding protein [Thalassotalea insulae]|uniref:Sugar ABC transporter substrate-binding protein n=1 Tax=Thalassotalea insulae TaxID=2056778 RepID=A0ABQ6GQM9_9GAMM|nr:substrate-binding domain-containing protein [Thalassotalea insulae]GLX78263.1 sugar ABC transporter substrate-binding protein [Thalassotalea insulae]